MYNIVDLSGPPAESWDLSEEKHDAWVLDRATNTIYYFRNGHHLDLMMQLKEQDPELAGQFVQQQYGNGTSSNFLFGDIEYGDFGTQISDYENWGDEDHNRSAELDATLLRFHKQAARQVIQNGIEIPTVDNGHGDGNPWILLDTGDLYYATSSESHATLFKEIYDRMNIRSGNDFLVYMERHKLAFGRMNNEKYRLYTSPRANNDLLPEVKQELADAGLTELEDSGEYLGADQRGKFVFVPSTEPVRNSIDSWRSLMIDTYTHTVFYSEPGKFHAAVINGIEGLAGEGYNDSGDFWNDERGIPGEYNITQHRARIFKSEAEVPDDLIPTIEQYFADEEPFKVTHIDNPGHILRKPFFWDENSNELIIGKEGTGFLYNSSFTLDTYVPNIVKEALVKMTINQAEGEWYEDMNTEDITEDIFPSYWDKQPNYEWGTSWIWFPDEQRLVIKNQPGVNHTDLLIDEATFPESAVYGILSRSSNKYQGRYLWQIVPYYSDAVTYGGESMPEFLDRGNANPDVDDAVRAVSEWLIRVKHLRPDQLTVHEAAELKPLEPSEPFYNWQGHEYRFEPTHEGVDRHGVNAYDGIDLVGSITGSDEGDFIYLRSAYVDPAYRGEGLFKELLDHIPSHKPVDGEGAQDSPLAGFFHQYNRRFAALQSEDQKKALEDAIFDNYVNFDETLAAKRTQDLLQLVDVDITELDYEAIQQRALEIRAENQRKAEELRRQFEEQAKADQYWVEVRYGYNRKTGEWWIVPSTNMIIHPNMLMEWSGDIYDNQDWYNNFDELVKDFVFGYAAYNPYDLRISVDEDESYDMPGSELTPVEAEQLSKLLKQWAKGGNGEERDFKGKLAAEAVKIIDLGGWDKFGITWVYNPEDDTLVLAPFNRMHASVIKEIWGGEEMPDRQYENFVAGMWPDVSPRGPNIIYGEKSPLARRATNALVRYVNGLKTSADVPYNHILIYDTAEMRHHGMGWPFLYDEQKDLLYMGNSEAFHMDLIKAMGDDANDIWERYYGEDPETGEYDEEMQTSIVGGRYDPQNVYEPFYFYDFTQTADKARIAELVLEGVRSLPPIDYEAKVATSPIMDYGYQWHDLTPYELGLYDTISQNERARGSRRARRQNDRAKVNGKEGRVHGRELYAIAQRFENKCAYCKKPLIGGTPDATFDHVLPLVLGGESVISNIVPSCLHCNQELNNGDTQNNLEIYDPADKVDYTVPDEFRNS